MTTTTATSHDFVVVYYIGNRKTGTLHIITRKNGITTLEHFPAAPDTGLEKMRKPILVGMTAERNVVLLNPVTRETHIETAFPLDGFPAHLYADPYSNRDWFMNDGDKDTGNDTLNCGNKGSSVTVIANTTSRLNVQHLNTLCVGRGHHQTAFTAPSPAAPDMPRRAYISNLNDGTISVIGNDEKEADTDLKLLATINLCEPEREDGAADKIPTARDGGRFQHPASGDTRTSMHSGSAENAGATFQPNSAFPHGLAYSSVTGELYNLNSGYGTLAIINPLTHAIEARMPLKGYSNLFSVPGQQSGRYLIARGADRKTDANHVIAKIAVLDTTTKSVVDHLDLPDIYFGKYYFNAEATKLYMTTGSSGSPEQQANIKADVLLAFDLTALPTLRLIQEIKTGPAGSVAFLEKNGVTERVFSSNAEAGSLVVIDGKSDAILETIAVTEGASHARVWMLGGRA